MIRNSNPRICFLEIVPERCKEVLTDVVCRNVNRNSLIITDEWKGYNDLRNKNFIHLKINHSKNFVDNNNSIIHTQNIESMWRVLRSFLTRKSNYSRTKITYYLKEFIYRSRIKTNIFEKYINSIQNINLDYLFNEKIEINFIEYEFI